MSRVSRFLEWEVVPASKHKYVFMLAGAFVGGVVFSLTQSWLLAIGWDLLAVLASWSILRISDPLGSAVISFFRLFRN